MLYYTTFYAHSQKLSGINRKPDNLHRIHINDMAGNKIFLTGFPQTNIIRGTTEK